MNNIAKPAPYRSRPRVGAIVWGVLFLAFCAWVTQRIFFPDYLTPGLWLTILAISLGVILLAVGVIIAARERKGPPNQDS